MKSTTLIWTQERPNYWRGRMNGRPEMTVALITTGREGQHRLTAAFQSDMEDRENTGTLEELKEKAQSILDAFIAWVKEQA